MPGYSRRTAFCVYGVLLALCWVALLTRFFVKKYLVSNLSADDWLMAASACTFTSMVALALRMTEIGLGERAQDLPEGQVREILKLYWSAELFYITTTVTVKISITILLLRLTTTKLYRYIVLGTSVFYSVCGVIFFFVITFQCWPIPAYWDKSIQGYCVPRATFAALIESNAAISLVTDAIFAIIPIWMIWKIQMNKITKISVVIVLGLGISTVGVNIARFFYLPGFNSGTDQTFVLYPIAVTSIFETGIAILAASLATCRPLLRAIIKVLPSAMTLIPGWEGSKYLNTTTTVERTTTVEEAIIVEKGARESTFDIEAAEQEWLDICRTAQVRAAGLKLCIGTGEDYILDDHKATWSQHTSENTVLPIFQGGDETRI